MKTRLDPSIPPGVQIREYLLVEIDRALTRAKSYHDLKGKEQPDVIRQIRKATKRARAAASLLEPSTSGRFRTRLRSCSRQLSDVRDRDVVRQTLGRLANEDEALHRHLRKGSLLEEILDSQGHEVEVQSEKIEVEVALEAVHSELRSVRKRATDLGRGELRWKYVIERVTRSWRRARRAFRSEWSADDIESLHYARKAVIRLQAQLAMVQQLDPERIKAVRKGLRCLSRQLGLDRDAVLVLERVESVDGSQNLATARKQFVKRLQRDRGKRLQRIRKRGKCILEPHSSTIGATMRRSIKHTRRGKSE